MSIREDIREEILGQLKRAEGEHGVRILYACESGSRAWNFASPDSDYDVRFIYAHTPDWYLSFDIERQRDVIEYPIVGDIDCNGWDIRKALYLDLDLSNDNLPPGTLLALGTAVVEVSSVPHTGCKKFVERFGLDAMTFVNSQHGKMLGLRGINAKVVKSGVVCTKDIAKKVS